MIYWLKTDMPSIMMVGKKIRCELLFKDILIYTRSNNEKST